MKYFRHTLLTALTATLCVLGSCQDGEEIIRTLEVGQDSFVADQKSQLKEIDVRVAPGETFTVDWVGDNWGSVEQDIAKIIIHLQENNNPIARYASVIISLADGKRKQVINITQNGNTPLLDVVPDIIQFPCIGGQELLKVASDLSQWIIETDAPWITVESFYKSNEIIVTALENDIMESKTAILTVTVNSGENSTSKEVTINMEPLPGFFIPYHDFGQFSIEAAIEYMESGDFYATYIGGASGPNNFHWFATKSALFPRVRYSIELGPFGSKTATLMIDEGYASYILENYGQYLEDNGFEYLYTNDFGYFYWKDLGADSRFHCLVWIDFDGYVTFTSEMERPNVDFPDTFEEVPTPPIQLPWGVGQNTVSGWEAANGGTLVREEKGSGYLEYAVPGSDIYYQRLYSFSKFNTTPFDDLSQMVIIYEYAELDKFFVKTVNGYMVNPRLFDLLINAGYSFLGMDANGINSFANKDTNLIIGIRGFKLADDPPTFLRYGALYYFPYTETTSLTQYSWTIHPRNLKGVRVKM